MTLEIAGVHKSFDDVVALNDINLTIGPHDFVCLLGPSGCGKTTLLRIVAGLLQADRGTLEFDGQDLSRMPPRNRNFGIVFQSYSLFPNMTVRENVGYGLRIRHEAKPAIAKRVDELLELVRIPDMADRFPWQLSGGQQQRVALARALAVDPRLILLDEPLSALDAKVRNEMRHEIREVQQRLQIPTIMVTHDQEEALMLADAIVCMNKGVIEQVGSPEELYRQPRTRFVADFVGISNFMSPDWLRQHAPRLLESAPPPEGDGSWELCVRPEQITVSPAEDELSGRIRDVTFLGNLRRLTVAWGGREFVVEQHAGEPVHAGDAVAMNIAPEAARWVSA